MCWWWANWTHYISDLERLLTDVMYEWLTYQNIDNGLRETNRWVNIRLWRNEVNVSDSQNHEKIALEYNVVIATIE